MRCRHHPSAGGSCPGCPLLDRPYAEQLATKRARLVAALSRYPHLELPEPAEIVPAVRTEAYRHRLKLPVHVGRDHVSVGLYGAGHRVLDTPDCPVLAEPLRALLDGVTDALAGARDVHSIDLRVSDATGEGMLVVACRGGQFPGGPRGARELRRRVPGLASVAVSRADPEGKRVMGSAPEVLAGSRFVEERVGHTSYRLHPGAFFQVDPRQAVAIHTLVRDGVGEARRVLDLYAGVGAYGLMLAPGRERVLLVEEVPQAAEAARQVAPDNVEVLASKVEAVALKGRWDAAVLNPARRGSDPATLRTVAGLVERLVYVSCGPETLARDLDALAAFGMRVQRIVPVDLFPQTPEVETVVTLVRGPSLATFPVKGGRARGPWTDGPSGAAGRPKVLQALVIGPVRPRGKLQVGTFERLGLVAGHALLRITLTGGTAARALGELKAWGHPVAGQDPRTAPFFAEKAGLLRPFVHVERDDRGAQAPLHGDLAEAIERLGGLGSAEKPRHRGKRRR
ncbi:MAG: class I SAM-dependent RNA methyltransferase [Myxococcales bacterium]|nr:class I SAM-dependent RNA methyltransferase [Myxococcales bacterium]